MRYYTDLDIYGHLSLDLSTDIGTDNEINNVPTANISFLRFTGSSPTISGFADGGENNKILIISHAGTGNLTLKNLSNNSQIQNVIVTGYDSDITMQPGHNAILIYDAGDSVWRMIAIPSAVLSIAGTQNQISITPEIGSVVLSLPQDIDTTSSPTFKDLNLFSADTSIIEANKELKIKSTTSNIIIDMTLDSSSISTGALVVKGGLGIEKKLYANEIYEKTNRVLTKDSSIDDLKDVDLSNKQNNFIIKWNSTTNMWESADMTSANNDNLQNVTGRGNSTINNIIILNEGSNALSVAGGIQSSQLKISGIKQRAGISPNLSSGIIDLSLNNYLFYVIDQNEDFLSDISFDNGTPGECFYVKIKSNGDQYGWDISNNYIKWPGDIIPLSSVINKVDMYHFICLSATEYLGTYVFNYS